ncbi:SET domain-containing protein [Bimuria novae-zelandiae CBS 107.79]|uniref:SET domain-containing protein n=1 Tax=Bimuria novae-zelandiae CBS 107.79 TaxID=1447943 RepID=A0A6A5V9Y2_9PLEO|nr:SET domain-containing protein [Bimuria novae-zelandiae CBS 107.79]
MDTHHRGRRLTIKRVSPVVVLTARSWTMVEDAEGGDTERLEMCLHKSRHGEDILEYAKSFMIKEPYYTLTEEGEATIRIDHPSDLISLSDALAGKTFSSTAAAEKFATACKSDGNAELKNNDLAAAHERYTDGLTVARQDIVSKSNPDLARDIARNRAYVNLLLNHFDEAISDAKASLIGRDDQKSKDLDSKAYYRAGSAAYGLGKYDDAKAYFEAQLKLSPNDKDASTCLKRIEVRMRELQTGSYNWKKLRAGLSRARPHVDAASFVSNIKVEDSAGRGRGMFVTRDIPAREVVMCDKAFSVVWGHDKEALTAMTYDVRDDRIRVQPVGLSKATVQKLLGNSSQIARVMDLFGDYEGDGQNIFHNEDGPIVDTFRIHDIVSRNGFGLGNQYGEEGARNASTGLCTWAAYINHSCIANTTKDFVGDLMVLRASRALNAGEEVFISYDESSDYEARQAALKTTWGFECNCPLCAAEKVDDASVRKKRAELATQAEEFVSSEHWANAKRLKIASAQRLATAIDATYDDERYKDIPRLAARPIQEWLTKASAKR